MVPTRRIRWGNLNNIIDKLRTDFLNKQLRHLEPLAIWRPSVWSCLLSSLFSPGVRNHLSSFLSLKYLPSVPSNLCHLLKTYYMPSPIHSKTFIFLILLETLWGNNYHSLFTKKIRLKSVVLQHNNKRCCIWTHLLLYYIKVKSL